MRRQVSLVRPVEPLQIPVPGNFRGERTNPDAGELYLTTAYTELSLDEIHVVEAYLKRLPYVQSLAFGTTFIDASDPLLDVDADYLDRLEQGNGLPSTRLAPGGGQRSIYERVLIIRESGYLGNGRPALEGR